ncbi:MAG: methyl-accepting chemotaxis protein, partial [Pseudomonadales bacterium]|nr:methyl-accepting chemotaxis protein [Pseudomonadales bacterium]
KSHSEIDAITASITQIAAAAGQQSMASEEINQAIEQISNAAIQNACGITELSSSSEHLNKLSCSLKGVTDKFIVA